MLRSNATLVALLLAALGAVARADDSTASLRKPGPVTGSVREGPTLAGWQPPKVVQELIDIVTAKPFPPPDPRAFVSKSRFGWSWLKERFDANRDGVITRQEFGAGGEWFIRLDRNHDGVLRSDDFDWSPHNSPMRPGDHPGPGRGPGGPGPRPQGPASGPGPRGPMPPGPGPAFPEDQFVRLIDRDNNGHISREEWNRFFEKLANKKGYFTTTDIRREIFQAGRLANEQRIRTRRLQNLLRSRGPVDLAKVDGLTVGLVLLAECFNGRNPPKGSRGGGKLAPAPEPGQQAPEFSLATQDGQRKISLADYRGRRPVVLVFGSVTWGPYRSQFGNIEELHKRYQDQAAFLAVYIREAHPSEGGEFDIKQPTTHAARCKVAKLCCTALNVTMPLVVDEIDDRVANAYQGMPDRIFLIDESGKVVYQGGHGPAGFRPEEMEQSLIMLLLERGLTAKEGARAPITR